MQCTGPRILVVSNQPERLIAQAPAVDGGAVTASTDGLHALMTALRDRPDLIVIERRLHGVNSATVRRMLARDSRLAGIPVLMVESSAAQPARRSRRTRSAALDLLGPIRLGGEPGQPLTPPSPGPGPEISPPTPGPRPVAPPQTPSPGPRVPPPQQPPTKPPTEPPRPT